MTDPPAPQSCSAGEQMLTTIGPSNPSSACCNMAGFSLPNTWHWCCGCSGVYSFSTTRPSSSSHVCSRECSSIGYCCKQRVGSPSTTPIP